MGVKISKISEINCLPLFYRISTLILGLVVVGVFFVNIGESFAQSRVATGTAVTATGSISGCEYWDANGNSKIEPAEQKLIGWKIVLEKCGIHRVDEKGTEIFNFNANNKCLIVDATTTGANGCYRFSGLSDGQYRVKQMTLAGWRQVYPQGFFYNIGLRFGENLSNIDFANRPNSVKGSNEAVCGNGIKEAGEECDNVDGILEGYKCSDSCALEVILAKNQPIPEVKGEAGAPNLTVGKLVLNSGTSTGGNITDKIFKIIVANNGNLTAFNVKVLDLLPPGLVFYNTDDAARSWNLGDIEPGQIKDLVYVVNLEKDAKIGDYINTARVYAANHWPVMASVRLKITKNDILANYGQKSNSQSNNGKNVRPAETGGTGGEPIVLGETGAPKLVVSKTINKNFANPGDNDVYYTVSVTNNGNLTAFAVRVVDTLQPGLLLAESGKAVGEWSLGDIAPGKTKKISFFVKIDDSVQPGIYENVATIGAANQAPISAAAVLEVRKVEVLGESNEAAPLPAEAPTLTETGFSPKELALLMVLIVILYISVKMLKKFKFEEFDRRLRI